MLNYQQVPALLWCSIRYSKFVVHLLTCTIWLLVNVSVLLATVVTQLSKFAVLLVKKCSILVIDISVWVNAVGRLPKLLLFSVSKNIAIKPMLQCRVVPWHRRYLHWCHSKTNAVLVWTLLWFVKKLTKLVCQLLLTGGGRFAVRWVNSIQLQVKVVFKIVIMVEWF